MRKKDLAVPPLRVFPGVFLLTSAVLSPAAFSACGPAALPPATRPAASASASASAAPVVQAEPQEGPAAPCARESSLQSITRRLPRRGWSPGTPTIASSCSPSSSFFRSTRPSTPRSAKEAWFVSSPRGTLRVRGDARRCLGRRAARTRHVHRLDPEASRSRRTESPEFCTRPQLGREPGHKVPFVSDADLKMKSDPRVVGRWAAAFASHLRGLSSGPWHQFAASRVEEVFGDKKKQAKVVAARPRRATGEELGMFDGVHDRHALGSRGAATRLPTLARRCQREGLHTHRKVGGTKLAAHPWDEMLRGLSILPPKRRSLPRCRQNFGTLPGPPIFRRCFEWSISSMLGAPLRPT